MGEKIIKYWLPLNGCRSSLRIPEVRNNFNHNADQVMKTQLTNEDILNFKFKN